MVSFRPLRATPPATPQLIAHRDRPSPANFTGKSPTHDDATPRAMTDTFGGYRTIFKKNYTMLAAVFGAGLAFEM